MTALKCMRKSNWLDYCHPEHLKLTSLIKLSEIMLKIYPVMDDLTHSRIHVNLDSTISPTSRRLETSFESISQWDSDWLALLHFLSSCCSMRSTSLLSCHLSTRVTSLYAWVWINFTRQGKRERRRDTIRTSGTCIKYLQIYHIICHHWDAQAHVVWQMIKHRFWFFLGRGRRPLFLFSLLTTLHPFSLAADTVSIVFLCVLRGDVRYIFLSFSREFIKIFSCFCTVFPSQQHSSLRDISFSTSIDWECCVCCLASCSTQHNLSYPINFSLRFILSSSFLSLSDNTDLDTNQNNSRCMRQVESSMSRAGVGGRIEIERHHLVIFMFLSHPQQSLRIIFYFFLELHDAVERRKVLMFFDSPTHRVCVVLVDSISLFFLFLPAFFIFHFPSSCSSHTRQECKKRWKMHPYMSKSDD